MANEIRDAWRVAWRKYVTDGVPSSGENDPDKEEILPVGDTIQSQVDAVRTLAATGTQWKTPVHLATTANLSALSGEQTIDGVLTNVFRVLVKNQTNPAQNGIYVTGPGAWARATDADSADEIVAMAAFVRLGTENGSRQYICTTKAPITVGATPLSFSILSDQASLNANLAAKADKTEVEPITERLDFDDFNYDFAVADNDGNPLFGAKDKFFFMPGGSEVIGGEYNYAFAVTDPSGNVICGMLNDEWVSPGGTAATDYLARDQANIERSNRKTSSPVTTVQRMTALYNTTVLYGQSLGRGQETWPALSRTNRFQNKMLGGNVLPSELDGATYPTFGSAVLNDLFAQTSNGAILYDDAAEAALPPGDSAFGEQPNHGWVNMAKFLHNQVSLLENDDSRLFVTFNPSVSGRTIEQLSKVNTQDAINRYARFLDGLAKIQAGVGSAPHVVAGILWMQGEYNYRDEGGSWDEASYKNLFSQLIDDMVADCMAATGQSLPPAFFTYQTGGAYTSDVDSFGNPGLHVGMAQLEVALEKSNVWMVGPTYPYTDKGGHLDSNGSRWFGNQVAKVYHHVVRMGKDWSPLRPVNVEKVGNTILIDFHVPVAPLAFDTPYRVLTPMTYADKGFRVTNSGGSAVGISSVEIIGGSIVKIVCASDPGVNGRVWYADKTAHDGNGMLRDSDPTVAFDDYVFTPEHGMYADANIPALVNKPYPLHNWCVAFCLPFTYSEL